jgi:hypothetical protein
LPLSLSLSLSPSSSPALGSPCIDIAAIAVVVIG